MLQNFVYGFEVYTVSKYTVSKFYTFTKYTSKPYKNFETVYFENQKLRKQDSPVGEVGWANVEIWRLCLFCWSCDVYIFEVYDFMQQRTIHGGDKQAYQLGYDKKAKKRIII